MDTVVQCGPAACFFKKPLLEGLWMTRCKLHAFLESRKLERVKENKGEIINILVVGCLEHS